VRQLAIATVVIVAWLTRLAQFAALGIPIVRIAAGEIRSAIGFIQIVLAVLLIWVTRRAAAAGQGSSAHATPLFSAWSKSRLFSLLGTIASWALLIWSLS